MISEWNINLFRMVNDLGKDYEYLNPVFIFIAEYTVYLLALTVLFFLFTKNKNNRIMVLSGVLTFVMAEVLGKLAGKIHSNNQPFAELPNVNQLIEKAVDNSFPSDHTMLFFSFCITFWLYRRKVSVLWILLAVFVAISRIGVGVHYPADVTVAALIATLSAFVFYVILPKVSFVHQLPGLKENKLPIQPNDQAKDI